MNTPLGSATPFAPAFQPAAVYQLPDLDALERISAGDEPGFIYARDDHPNGRQLESELARLEHARWAIVAGSGMSALSLAFLAGVQPGERLLVSEQLYGRTTQLALSELPRLGVAAEAVDTLNLAETATAFAKPGAAPATLLLVETLTNPLMRVADVASLAELCRRHRAKLLVDNTFATPLFCRPLEHGATWVMESLTKSLSGHSDVTLGVLAGNDESEKRLRQLRSVWGFHGAPFDCWLTLRGLETFPLRMQEASRNAAALADWLAAQPNVNGVHYPGRAGAAERELMRGLLDGQGGAMLSFELSGGRGAVNRFLKAGTIPFCPSLGDVKTTCSYPDATSHRYVPEAEKRRLGITPGLVRLSVGCEPLEELRTRLAAALAAAR